MSFEIATIPENNLPQIMIVEMENKPLLAKAYENPRISQYPIEIRNNVTLSFITWCLDILGVNDKDGGTGHHVAAHDFVNSGLTRFTYQELREAMLMYVRGEFKEPKLTQQFNSVVLAKVMQAFSEHRDIALNSYLKARREKQIKEQQKANELTPHEKMELTLQGINFCLDKFNETKKVIAGYFWVYDYFEELGIMNTPDEVKIAQYKTALSVLKVEAKGCKTQSIYKAFMKEIEVSKSPKVITRTKVMLLEKYLHVQITEKGFLPAKEFIINQVKKLDKTV